MNNKEHAAAVKKMQDFIAERLNQDITMKKLSNACNYSPYFAARIFKEYTGCSPFEYIRKMRLTNAAKILRNGFDKVIDVALNFEFDSHEGFTRAFSKEFGISPYKYKTNPVPIKYFIPYDSLNRWLTKNKEVKKMENKKTVTIFTQVIERPKRKAIIKRGINAKDYYEYCNEVSCDIWGVLESIKEASYESAGFWLPEKLIKKGTSKYVQGVEVPLDYHGAIPEGFEIIDLEEHSYMVFQGPPFDDAVYEEAISDVWESIDSFNPEIYGFLWADESAPRFQLAPLGYRGYIEARPIKKK